MKWISVKDELPNHNQNVLVFKINLIGDPYYTIDFMRRDSYHNIYWMKEGAIKYTHWMPLPEPPKP